MPQRHGLTAKPIPLMHPPVRTRQAPRRSARSTCHPLSLPSGRSPQSTPWRTWTRCSGSAAPVATSSRAAIPTPPITGSCMWGAARPGSCRFPMDTRLSGTMPHGWDSVTYVSFQMPITRIPSCRTASGTRQPSCPTSGHCPNTREGIIHMMSNPLNGGSMMGTTFRVVPGLTSSVCPTGTPAATGVPIPAVP